MVAHGLRGPFFEHRYTHNGLGFNSLYDNCVATHRNLTKPDPQKGRVNRWAEHFHSYDRLTPVNTKLFMEVGGWDTMIPFYMIRKCKLVVFYDLLDDLRTMRHICEGFSQVCSLTAFISQKTHTDLAAG